MSLSVCTGMWVLGSDFTKLFIIILFNRFVTDCCHFCCFFDSFIHVYIGTHVIFIAKIRWFISNGVQPLSPLRSGWKSWSVCDLFSELSRRREAERILRAGWPCLPDPSHLDLCPLQQFQFNTRRTNGARLNLSICLLLAHALWESNAITAASVEWICCVYRDVSLDSLQFKFLQTNKQNNI